MFFLHPPSQVSDCLHLWGLGLGYVILVGSLGNGYELHPPDLCPHLTASPLDFPGAGDQEVFVAGPLSVNKTEIGDC